MTNPGGANYISNKNIQISGHLIIDENVQFLNCNFKMGGDGKITIADGNNGVFIYSNLFACNNMWQGIIVETGCRFAMYGCDIEDARIAVHADENAPIFMSSNDVNRNRIGIQNRDGNPSAGLLLTTFTNNRFKCTSPLNNGSFVGQAGMRLEGTATSIPQGNQFSDTFIGIESINSDVTMKGNSFTNIRDTGVETTQGTMNVDGCRFTNCFSQAVEATGTNLTVTNSEVRGHFLVGINSLLNLNTEEVHIAGNQIQMNVADNYIGIALERTKGSGEIPHNIVEENVITMNGQDYELEPIGIFVVDQTPANAIDDMLIQRNDIRILKTADAQDAILLFIGDMNNCKVRDNYIQYTTNEIAAFNVVFPPSQTGIHLSSTGLGNGGFSHEISGNRIIGVKFGDNSYNMGASIHLDHIGNTKICNNRLDNSLSGLHFRGNCDYSDVAENDINRHADGLLIDNGAFTLGVVGPQIRNDNRWTGNSGDYDVSAARHVNSNFFLSPFIVQNVLPEVLPTNVSPSTGWFDLLSGEVNGCPPEEGTPNFSPYDDALLNDFASYNISEVTKFNANYKAISRWLTDGVASFSETADYLSANNDKPFYELATATKMIKEALSISADQQMTLDANQASKNQLLQELRSLDAAQPAYDGSSEPFDGTNEDYAQSKNLLLTELISLKNERQNVLNAINAQRLTALNQAKNYLNGLTTSAVYETNMKTLLSVVVENYTGEISSDNYQTTLENILNQNPASAGISWAFANSYFVSCGNNSQFSEQSIGNIQNEVEAISSKLEVYPNPAKSEVKINFPHLFTGDLTVMDITGKTILQEYKLVESNSTNLSVGELPNGIYILIAVDELTNQTHQEKLVIKH